MADADPRSRPGVRADQAEPAATGTDTRVPEVLDWQRAADTGRDRRTGATASTGSTDRMPRIAGIPRDLLRAIVSWSLEGRPNEACGLLAAPTTAWERGVPTRFLPLTNAAASPYRYLIDPDEQLRAMLDIDDADEVVWGIVHSHVASRPVPSDTDVGLAMYPETLYLICSLAMLPPEVRAWSIRGGVVTEVVLEPVSSDGTLSA